MRARLGLIVVIAVLGGLGSSLMVVLPTSATSNLVRITATLEPATITIAQGDSITWRNDDTQRHRMRSTSGPADFDSGNLDPGQSHTVSLTALGTYTYLDDRDPDLSNYWGTIQVVAPTLSPAPGATGVPTPPPGASEVVINMAGRVFRPSTTTISNGGRVTWVNDDSRDHTATSTSGAFDSGLMAPGARFVRTFPAAGTFSYICMIHPDMTGSVVVTSLPGVTPPPPTPPPAPTPVPVPATGNIRIVDFAFTPSDFTADAGTRLVFANTGAALHTVTAIDGSFDSGLIPANGTYQRVFATPGTFKFLCALHPAMSGVIRVRGAAGATPLPQPSPAPRTTAPPDGVRIVDFAFLSGQIQVLLGTTVSWVNEGVAPHTVTARGGSFDSGVMAPRSAFQQTFTEPGTFAYLCALHPDMTGVVIVVGNAGDAGGRESPDGAPVPAGGGNSGGGNSGGGTPSGASGAGADPSGAARVEPRSATSIAFGLLLILGGLAGGFAVVRDVGRRAARG